VNERGSGSVLAAAVLALLTLVTLAVLATAQIVIARSRAAAAADAAALAAAPMTFPPVSGGRSPVVEAMALASENGARLVSCLCSQVATWDPRRVEVTVAFPVDVLMLGRRWVHASSAAEFVP
jgi:secretion/DNA translocation related TadE-like protein